MKTLQTGSLIIMMLLISTGIKAQKMKYGIQGGLNGALQSDIGALYDNNDFRTTYRIGVFTNYKLSDKFKTQVEINYDRRGSENDEMSNAYDYLTIPILANYQLHEGVNKPWAIEVFIGPNAAFLVNAETTFNTTENPDIDLFEDSKKVELGAIGGFVMKYPIQDNNLLFNINYTLGLTKINDFDTDIRNKVINVSIGYEF